MRVITWRWLWFRLRQVWRLRRARFQFCGECGAVLTPDETTVCVDCIELKQAARERLEREWSTASQRGAMNVAFGYHSLASAMQQDVYGKPDYMIGARLLIRRSAPIITELGSAIWDRADRGGLQ